MSVADDLEKLHQLHQSGALSDTDLATAKARLLAGGDGNAAPAVAVTMPTSNNTPMIVGAVVAAGALLAAGYFMAAKPAATSPDQSAASTPTPVEVAQPVAPQQVAAPIEQPVAPTPEPSRPEADPSVAALAQQLEEIAHEPAAPTPHRKPWAQVASAEARKLFFGSGDGIANAIQRITHPSGVSPTLQRYEVVEEGHQVACVLEVAWHGGILGTSYVTRIAWRFADSGHISASVATDSAVMPVAPANALRLDEYFRDQLYPQLSAEIEGSR